MNRRGAGILLHVTSLPSPYGVGDLGPWAYKFADFLVDMRQSFWQVLPLSPTTLVYGNSPYSSISTFAGNTLLISPDLLAEQGLVSAQEIDPEAYAFSAGKCEYDKVTSFKQHLLNLAHERFKSSDANRDEFLHFCEANASWLDNYALFLSLKKRFGGKPWNEWPWELRDRLPEPLEAASSESAFDVEREKLAQYLFFKQWHRLKQYCNDRGVQIIGDIPIYVSYDSPDVWANPAIFKLDAEKRPSAVAGVPPDYFSATGQLWGNPVYNWDVLREANYSWWIQRMRHMLSLYDIVRIDHFRGLIAYWEVPAYENNAINGRWADVPFVDFFNQLFRHFSSLPIIAEDLGLITPDVREAVRRFGFPGMKVLLFAFGEDNPLHIYLPHSYEKNYVVYTGTHDNNTARGWFEREARPDERERLCRYVGRDVGADDVNWELIRLAMMSVADLAIVPLQDVLGLGQEAQMNRPSVARDNWEWRVLPDQITEPIIVRLRSLTQIFGRA